MRARARFLPLEGPQAMSVLTRVTLGVAVAGALSLVATPPAASPSKGGLGAPSASPATSGEWAPYQGLESLPPATVGGGQQQPPAAAAPVLAPPPLVAAPPGTVTQAAISVSLVGVPPVALTAYRAAAGRLAADDPGCGLRWAVLAAIGQVESGHGGGLLAADGTAVRRILGPVLSGAAGLATIPDTDGGRLDGDSRWDRAVGPMQFLPSTWAGWGVDANGDGRADPENVFDAALAAGRYLCAAGGDLRRPANLARAVHAYNHADWYVRLVLRLTAAYEAGQPVVVGAAAAAPSGGGRSSGPAPSPTTAPAPTPTSTPTSMPTATPTASPTPTGAPTATGTPAPSPSVTPAPTTTPTPTGSPLPACDDPSGSPSPEPSTTSPGPSPSGSPSPTQTPTPVPTPTPAPTATTPAPTPSPTGSPTATTPAPTGTPTGTPTGSPSPSPTCPGPAPSPTSTGPSPMASLVTAAPR